MGRGGSNPATIQQGSSLRAAAEEASGFATSIHYLYRDADNYKTGRTVVLRGRPTADDIAVIKSALDEGMFFIPSQVGLDDLQETLQQYDAEVSNDSDHPWHEMGIAGNFRATTEEPTDSLTVAELVEAFKTVTWNAIDA